LEITESQNLRFKTFGIYFEGAKRFKRKSMEMMAVKRTTSVIIEEIF